jgi:hypothetical protein
MPFVSPPASSSTLTVVVLADATQEYLAAPADAHVIDEQKTNIMNRRLRTGVSW